MRRVFRGRWLASVGLACGAIALYGFTLASSVFELYVSSSTKQRAGALRNGAEELSGMVLGDGDVDPLAAFLRALNEDYD